MWKTGFWYFAVNGRFMHRRSQLRLDSYLQARKIACIIGHIIAMGLAIGPVSRFMTRSLYAVLESRHAWCESLCLSSEAWKEIAFWRECLVEYKAQPIWHSPSAVIMCVVYSDASDTGYGAWLCSWAWTMCGPCPMDGWGTESEFHMAGIDSSTTHTGGSIYEAIQLVNALVFW